MKPLKRVVLKEELVELTKDYKKAIILNQFIYWSERVSDFDKFISEEKDRCKRNDIENNQELLNGWMYKSAEDLSEETMLGLSKSNMGTHIKNLIDSGWLSERNNPIFKWDRTKQYRVNIVKIQRDLYNLGYALEGYPLINENLIKEMQVPSSVSEHAENTGKLPSSETEPRSSKTEHASHEIELQNSKTEPQSTQNRTAIPEITTEITTDIFSQSVSHKKNDRPTDEEQSNNLIFAIQFIKDNYSGDEQQLLIESIKEIAQSDKLIKCHDKYERQKNIPKLIDATMINYAIEKFKATCSKEIKNPQKYFTTILYNMVFEYGAINITKKVDKQTSLYNKNKFHNFTQRTKQYTAEELKKIGQKKFEEKLKELGIKMPEILENGEKENEELNR